MPSAQPHLASWERRLLAAAVDASLLLVLGMVLYGISHTAGAGHEFPWLLALLYVVYQSAGLHFTDLSLGRTVAGISVLSVRRGGQLTITQVVARPVVRLLLLAIALAVGTIFQVEWIVAIPIALELALIAHSPWRRTVADFVVGTIVVNKPPMQPHRAPAFPMFSAKDDEFGPKP